jgi:hypothetical protein
MNKGIHVQAPSTSYSLAFKHLRGEVKLVNKYSTRTDVGPKGNPRDIVSLVSTDNLVYVSGGREYNHWEVVQLLMESPPLEQLPDPMLRGHTLATAVYVGGSEWFSGSYEIGIAIVPGPNHKVTKRQLRRAALTEAVAELPAVDRAYFHLVLSGMEGRQTYPTARHSLRRKPIEQQLLHRHLDTHPDPYWPAEYDFHHTN